MATQPPEPPEPPEPPDMSEEPSRARTARRNRPYTPVEAPTMRKLVLFLLSGAQVNYGDMTIRVIQLGAAVVLLRVNGVEMRFYVHKNHWYPYSWAAPTMKVGKVTGIINEEGTGLRVTNINTQELMAVEAEDWARMIFEYVTKITKENP